MATATARKRTTSKATTTRKAGTAKAKVAAAKEKSTAAKAKTDGPSKREAQAVRDAKLTDEMLELREAGESWSAVGEALSITPGKAQFLLMLHRVATGDVKPLRFRNDDELAAVIKKARDAADEFSSWGWIAARTGVSEPKLKKLHEESNGWKPKTENISIVRAAKNGDGKTTTKKTAASTKAGTASASKAAKAKARARTRGKTVDPT